MNPITAQFVFNSSESPKNFFFSLVGRPDPTTAPNFAGYFAVNSVAIGPNGNIVHAGGVYPNAGGQSAGYVYNNRNDGSVNWQRVLSTTFTEPLQFQQVSIDSANNVYIAGSLGYVNASGFGGTELCFYKYDSNGTLQFQRSLRDTTFFDGQSPTITPWNSKIDKNDNIYVVGDILTINTTDFTRALVLKYNTAGVLQWQRTIRGQGTTSQECAAYCLTIDTSGDVYVGGKYATAGFDTIGYITKYNTSGTIQWQRYLYDTPGVYGDVSAMTNDAQNNIIVGMINYSDRMHVVKYNSAGTLLWSRKLTAPAFSVGSGEYPVVTVGAITCITGDGSTIVVGNVGYSTPGASGLAEDNYTWTAKYSANGVLEYQRSIKTYANASGWDTFTYDAVLDPSSNVIYHVTDISLDDLATNYSSLLKGLRTNGGNLGTFPLITSNITVTIATGVFTEATGAITAGTVTLTGLTPTYTTGTTTLGTGFASGTTSLTVL